ncbi:MAG: aryl-sulfate sulfotransferase [Lutimonas sp.]|jgi:hypothetical protein
MKRSNFLALIMVILFISCESDPINEEIPEPVVLSPNIDIYEPDLLDNSYVLAMENGGTDAYLLDRAGYKIKTWKFDKKLGNDLEIMPDGKLLGIFKSDNPVFSFGGFGGIVKIFNTDGSEHWSFEYAGENYIAHHDVEMLPNGNLLIMVWERIKAQNANEAGIDVANDIYPEALIEVDPKSDRIVWEWHSFDHVVQDQFPDRINFGEVSQNPQLIDFNYNPMENGDIMHANGIDFDPVKNLIYISVNFYHEVWVLDHSTTTEEAKTSKGGNYNKGGDLVYRFGNPTAYKSNYGARLFNNNHFPNFLEKNEIGAGNLLIFVNKGLDDELSTVYELDLPENYDMKPDTDIEPGIVWQFGDPDLSFGRISGAVRLKNGNTLICEGDFGYWEVTPNGEVAWKYNGLGDTSFWRGYAYAQDSEEIKALGLD